MNRESLLALAAILTFLCGCEPPHNALWGNETEDASRLVVKYNVHGYASGEPLAVVLVRYQRGEADAPSFSWTSQTLPNGTHEFSVDGKVIPATATIQLFVNDAQGKVRTLDVDQLELRQLFQAKADPSRERLLEFWDRHVQPALKE